MRMLADSALDPEVAAGIRMRTTMMTPSSEEDPQGNGNIYYRRR